MSAELAIGIYLACLVFVLSAVWSFTRELASWAAERLIARLRRGKGRR